MSTASIELTSIIIVTAGAGDYLERCLDSISKQTHKNFEVFVIDNSHQGRLKNGLSPRYPFAVFSPGPENNSYSGSLNKGMQFCRGDFILCLNDDCILDDRFIEEALKGFCDDKVGMVCGKLLRWDNTTLDSTGLFLTFWRTAKERGYGRKDTGKYRSAGFVFGATGAAAFYRRKMLDEIREEDYFDNNFGYFYEDLDVAWRAKRAGWKGYYVPLATARHLRGGTARSQKGQGKPFARRFLSGQLQAELIKNRYLTIIKNESFIGFLLHLPAVVLYDCLVWGYTFLFIRPVVKIFLKERGYIKRAIQKRLAGK